MNRTPEEAFSVALYHFDAVAEHVKKDTTSAMAVDAIAMRLTAGITAMSKLDHNILDALFAEWRVMRGMRNRLVHGYILTDPAVVIDVAVNELPAIAATIRRELRSGS